MRARNSSLNNFDQDGTNRSDIEIKCCKCDIFSDNFSSTAELHWHSFEHPQGKILKCRFCDLPQTKQSHVTQPESNCHKTAFSVKQSHVCPLCDDDSFTQVDELDKHMYLSHRCEKYWLEYKASINKQLSGKPASELSLERHRLTIGKTSMGKTVPNDICSLCGNSFAKRSNLERHIRTVHNCMKFEQLLDTTSANDAFDLKAVTESTCTQGKLFSEAQFAKDKLACLLCKQSFVGHCNLNRHICTVHGYEQYAVYLESLSKSTADRGNVHTDIFECPDCDFQCSKRASMQRHFKTSHALKHKNQSKNLMPQFSSSALTKDQRLRVLDAVSFHCDLCGRKFRQMSDVSAHIQNHVKIPLHCEKCDIVFTIEGEYKKHNLSHHENMFSCRRCGDTFETVVELTSHTLNVHRKGLKRRHKSKLQMCQKCSKFYPVDNLRQHLLIVHTKDKCKNKEPFICDVCGQKYQRKPHYFNHLREHKGLKRIICKICNKVFLSEENLRIHKRTHPAVPKPFKCRYCDVSFRYLESRRKHENCRHIWNYSKQCPDCGKLFLDNQRLKQHSVVHTKQRKYECSICEMKFTQPSSLGRHKKIHSEDKKHECTECGLKFVQKYSLTRHMLVHSGVKPHQCLQCPQAFRQVFMLTQHVRKQHSSAE